MVIILKCWYLLLSLLNTVKIGNIEPLMLVIKVIMLVVKVITDFDY